MKRPSLVLFVVGVALMFHLSASAEVVLSQSVVGNGGGEMASGSYVVSGSTLGQAAVGVMTGTLYRSEVGFSYTAGIAGRHTNPSPWRGDRGWKVCVSPSPQENPDSSNPAMTLDLLIPGLYLYPNPFSQATTLEFSIPKRCRVSIALYDVAGREVRRIVDEELDPGRRKVVVDATGLASGIYFCRMKAADFSEVKKVMLSK